MTTGDARKIAIVAVIAVAPLAIVLAIALLRGYTITTVFHRADKRGGRDTDHDSR
jgi:hypothetical protein